MGACYQRLNLLFISCLLSYSFTFSQEADTVGTELLAAEKVYLQLTSKEYTTNQTIWFKAIVTDYQNHTPTNLSGVLYVDLINREDSIVAHNVVKLTNGIGKGSFDLDEDLAGRFLIRAYTRWNQNFGDDHTFKKYINIYSFTEHGNTYTFDGLKPAQNLEENIALSGLDLQFFPESGKMIHGFENKIGFKALGFDGKGRKIKGEVIDGTGKRITSFKSNDLGMGTFRMPVDSNSTYYAKVGLANRSDDILFPLPIAQAGSILSIEKLGEKIRFSVSSNALKDSVAVKASCRGMDYYLIEGALHNGRLVSDLPSKNFPNGIIVFTLMDKGGKPIAERLYFNHRTKNGLQLAIDTDKVEYGKREQVKLDIRLNGQQQNASTNASVMVLQKTEWRESIDGSIVSFFNLESELKGAIENPGSYFDKDNSDRFKDMDALLLTQGWRNYKYPSKRQGKRFFWPQPTLDIKGRVAPLSSKKRISEKTDLTLTTFGKETTVYTAEVDSFGNFQFMLDDTFGSKMRFLLHANSNGKRKRNLKITIDSFPKPKTTYLPNPFAQKADTITKAFLENQQNQNRIEMVFDSLFGVTQLDEVVVEDYKLTPERKALYEKYGEPDVIITGDSLEQKKQKWSYGIYSILLFNYGDEVQIERFPDGFMLAHVAGGPTLLMVDGRLLQSHEYGHVPLMPPEVVENIEIIKFAKFFKSRYLTVFPETDPLMAPYVGHIISITTKGKVGIHATNKPIPGTLDTTMEVFSPVKEFYAPKYDKPVPVDEQKPDLRSLLHWNPNLIIDETGKISESFYNGDLTGDFVIIVEAISEDGQIGYQEKTFSIEE
ncbi:hypothetical protein [Flagellimonas sp. 2504JD4-2]